jgi:hypothetical protein
MSHLTNHIQPNEIYTIKLTTGEEVVARVVNIHDDVIEIQHPILTVLSPQGLQMMPGLFSANLDRLIQLNKSNWVLIAECREDVRNSWIQATTGIAPVTKQIITG